MLRGHRQKDLFEGIRVIVDQGQDPAESVDEVIEETAIDLGFDAIDEEGEVARDGCKGLGADRWMRRNVSD
jgi:hypothetical protein